VVNRDFGKKVHYYRKRARITQGELGRQLGLSQVTIAHYETGRRFPKGKPLRELAQILGVSVDTLLGVETDAPSLPREFRVEELLDLLLEQPLEKGWQYLRTGRSENSWTAEDVFVHVLVPLMAMVGDRWARRELIISQEHVVSEKVRTLIDLLVTEEMEKRRIVPDKNRRWMGLCAPSEQHELVLYMCCQIMKLRGWDVRYLGMGVPLQDLRQMLGLYKPEMLVFSITMRENQNGLGAYLEALKGQLGNIRLLIGGRGWDGESGGTPGENIDYADTIESYIALVDKGETDERVVHYEE